MKIERVRKRNEQLKEYVKQLEKNKNLKFDEILKKTSEKFYISVNTVNAIIKGYDIYK